MRLKFNIFDLIIILGVIIAVLGFFLIRSGIFTPSSKVIQEKREVVFDVFLKNKKVSGNNDLFKAGGKTFITIRNVPHAKIEIVNVEKTPVRETTTEPSDRYSYNFLVTVKDNAIITADGPVIGGNKIKIGIPIVLEGYNYKLDGIVSDVK